MGIPDEPRLTLGILDAELAVDAAGRATAEEILNHRGSSATWNPTGPETPEGAGHA